MILDMLISISLTSSVTQSQLRWDIKGDRRVLGQNVTVPRDGGILGTGEATQESLLHLMGNTVSSTNSTLHNHRQQAWEGSSLS